MSVPVARISLQRSRACARSWRPSTSRRSASGASRRALPSAGRMRTWWPRSARPGSTSADGCRALVRSRSVLMTGLLPFGAGTETQRWASAGVSCREQYRNMGTSEIEVHYWASARAAAGVAGDTLEVDGPITLQEILDRAVALHPGTRLPDVLAICSTLVGDRPVNTEDPSSVLVKPG